MSNGQGGGHSFGQFMTARSKMLASMDIARVHANAHDVCTHHGVVAEAEFRQWLSTFLPRKYGVCSGYVVSQGKRESLLRHHYDVIIYDELNSPILWIESHPDASNQGSSRAIPAEHVLAIFELKATLTRASAEKALRHLADLEPLLVGFDAADERYPRFLPTSFFCYTVFFDCCESEEELPPELLLAMSLDRIRRGYCGPIVLRKKGSPEQSNYTGKMFLIQSENSGISQSFAWLDEGFSMFAFDVLARLNGTYHGGMMSSFHGLLGGVDLPVPGIE